MSQTLGSRKSVLLTGATGFVGSHLADMLVRQGYGVACLVRRETSRSSALLGLPIRLIEGDLSDRAALRKAVVGVDNVYHLAGSIKATSRKDYFRVNQLGTRYLLEAIAETNSKIRRFVHMSSLAAAGPSSDGRSLSEEDRPNPMSWYGESKLRSEEEVLRLAGVFPVTILRPSAIYGPRDRETLAIFRLARYGILLAPRGLERRFSLIHVNDVAEACVRAGERETPSGRVYFVSRPEIYGWEQVVSAIARALGKSCRRITFPAWTLLAAAVVGDLSSRITNRPTTFNTQKVSELLQPAWICNPSKARTELEFRPAVELEEGIQETARWYRENGWL